jgi:hypothetical protein
MLSMSQICVANRIRRRQFYQLGHVVDVGQGGGNCPVCTSHDGLIGEARRVKSSRRAGSESFIRDGED